MTKTVLQMCYEFRVLEGYTLGEELVIAMACALDVTVIYTPEHPSCGQGYDPVNVHVRLYQVTGSDLQLAIGYDAKTRQALGRLTTPHYLEHVKIVHAEHVDGKYFDMINVEHRFGQLLGVFLGGHSDEPYFNQ